MTYKELTAVTEGQAPVRFFFSNIDGYFLPDDPAAVLAIGLQNDVPTITGINADRLLADQISGYWMNFIKAGNPNGEVFVY